MTAPDHAEDAATSEAPETAVTSEAPEQPEAVMRIVSGSPSAQERAAVEAVLVGLAEEWAETKHRRVLDSESEWQAKSRTPTGHRWKRD